MKVKFAGLISKLMIYSQDPRFKVQFTGVHTYFTDACCLTQPIHRWAVITGVCSPFTCTRLHTLFTGVHPLLIYTTFSCINNPLACTPHFTCINQAHTSTSFTHIRPSNEIPHFGVNLTLCLAYDNQAITWKLKLKDQMTKIYISVFPLQL